MSAEFLADVLEGLSRSPKSLPSKHFYDAEGSRLFEAITASPEYYPTRTETALLERIAPEVAARMPDGGALVEFGSGASVKTRILLDAAPKLGRYVPVDISRSALEEAAAVLRTRYPALAVEPVAADFTGAVSLPAGTCARGCMGFFPGSTLGNFDRDEQEALLGRTRRMLGEGSTFLVGVDLVKDEAALVRAYDDAGGVTAAFNRNLLARMRRELGSDVDPAGFDHRAVWNAAESRMEMHLVSRTDQAFTVGGRTFHMRAGETIHTENSFKFTVEGLSRTAERAGWRVGMSWVVPDPAYALVLLEG